ncbi:MAG: benzoyl-CoA 2,3-epoxidase subunit BoxB [Deltaproteobacteria bacterium]|nr:benzoyl-CoA 2,3-epoxidase subunit BoxB [Deltaproteobacteria bacterium]
MTATISNDKIPNNVNLSSDKRLQRALEQWQPNFISWWKEMGPEGFQEKAIYLRTAISVDTDGWAIFDHVKMPDYRWGIFLAEPDPKRTIPFGDNMGQPAWQEIPGEHRNSLRRLIVTQGDTEPASVEQQRLLALTAPSLYDMRNLFQVNVEEGRHLWAMVYLLHSYFGSDGREEAEELLQRRSGNVDKPRILTTFNEPISDWLSFFMFTTFTDRDGKYQLKSLAESGFDPLSRTCRFMLTEEAHHMFVGQTSVRRVIKRACELMKEHNTEDIKPFGGVPLTLIQKYVNFWYSSSVDLFGNEVSTNAAAYFASGLKGRCDESKYTDHVAKEGTYQMDVLAGDAIGQSEIPLRNAMNEILRDDYVKDCLNVLTKWNLETKEAGVDFQFTLPSRRFHRKVGQWSESTFDPLGNPISQVEYDAKKDQWLPTEADRAFVRSLMVQVTEPGKMANWIAPPLKGINDQPVVYEYVKL